MKGRPAWKRLLLESPAGGRARRRGAEFPARALRAREAVGASELVLRRCSSLSLSVDEAFLRCSWSATSTRGCQPRSSNREELLSVLRIPVTLRCWTTSSAPGHRHYPARLGAWTTARDHYSLWPPLLGAVVQVEIKSATAMSPPRPAFSGAAAQRAELSPPVPSAQARDQTLGFSAYKGTVQPSNPV